MGKAKQVDLNNEPVSPVSVKKEPVKYVKETYDMPKFKCVVKDCDVAEAVDNDELEDLVRQKLRAKKGEKIVKGETDDAVKEILAKLEED